MSDTLDQLGAALGRIPSGIFILTARNGESSTGMLASWVQQAGFNPPMLTVAVRDDRYVGDWILESGTFALNQVAAGNKGLLKHFARGYAADEDAFSGIPLVAEQPCPILADACSYLVCEVAGVLQAGDHRVLLGKVVQGERVDPDAEPMVHLRKSGRHY